jgi:dihydrofolate reductase
MTKVTAEISVSLDGFVAGPNATLEEPLGQGGELLHEWVVPTKTFQEMHGRDGADGVTNSDDELFAASVRTQGAVVMGRRMFSGGEGPWEQDSNPNGWWGDEPPFHTSVFVLTHHAREPLVLGETTFVFVTDGIENAIERARAAAGERDVHIGGGAQAIQQAITAGLLDELRLHVVPVVLGGGVRLFENVGRPEVERTQLADSPAGVTHLTFSLPR